MGTRSATGFVLEDGTEKVSYSQYDGDPDCTGVAVLDFIHQYSDEEIKAIAERIQLVKHTDKPTEEQKQHCREQGTIDLTVGEQTENSWYCLLRKAQGGLMAWGKGLKYMLNARWFLLDETDCQWAYLVNVGKHMLEVYNNNLDYPVLGGRYAKDGGVNLICQISLEAARKMSGDDFVNYVNETVEKLDNVDFGPVISG